MKKTSSLRLRTFASKLFGNAKTRNRKRTQLERRILRAEPLEARKLMAGDITGSVFNDLNSNGINESTENGLPGWTVFADRNGDGQFNPGEPSTVTDAKGKYALLGLPTGPTSLYEIPQDGFKPTPGFTDHTTISVRDNREVHYSFPNVTAPVTTGSIRGTLFEDDNFNGTKDSGEHGITGWTVFLDVNGDGVQNASERSTLSDADGDYLFSDVLAGSITVYEIPQAGMRPITSGLFPLEGASDHHAVTVIAGNSVRSDFANLVPPIGTIQGTVWDDANGDGLRGPIEAPMSNQTVYVDLNSNNVQDAGEPSRLTDANGTYAFADIRTGVYHVNNVLAAGYRDADGWPASRTVNVFQGSVMVTDFFNLIPTTGSLGGSLWNDQDGNGIRGPSEVALEGWQVYIDQNGNGVLDASESVSTTSVDGGFAFADVPYGYVTLREVMPAEWIGTNPVSGALSIHLLNAEHRTGLNFGVREKVGTIQGTVWNDENGDRVHNPSESGLAERTLFLDINLDGVKDAAEPSAVTGANGSYQFNRVPNGAYHVVEILPSGWIASEGKSINVATTVTTGSVSSIDFFNLVPLEGSVSGVVWNDLDSSGTQSVTETQIAGWQVYVDLNKNNAYDAGEPQATTDSAGVYTLTGVPYGTNVIREIIQPGFNATSPLTGSITSFVLNGEAKTGISFGVHELTDFTITGTAFHDLNHNGLRDPGESGLSGTTVFLDLNNNGALDPAEPLTITSVDLFYTPSVNEVGTYSFTHLTRGSYSVIEIVPAELAATPQIERQHTVIVGPGSGADVNFANVYRANEIHGYIFDDTDADQIHDANEYGRSGIGVYIDLDRDDIYDVDEPRATTGEDGAYAFVGLNPGAYIVREMGGTVGPHTYPTTGGGILWPVGTSHPAIGNVSPTDITTSLSEGQIYTQTISLTLPGSGTLTDLVDVFLLFDDTGSFTANSPIVRDAFPTIISSLQASLPGIDLGFGVGRLEEYGAFAAEFSTGRPFILNQPIVASDTTGFATSIQSALDRVAPGYGGDAPETDIEALFQLVTGRGFDGNNNGTVLDSGRAGLAATQTNPGGSGDVPSFDSFVADPTNNVLPAQGSLGGAGFRSGALPIVLLATDTGFAYQPKGETNIFGAGGISLPLSALTQASRDTTPFSSGAGIQETVTGLNALGALVIGLGTNPEATIAPRQTLESLAKLTGAVNQSVTTINNGTADPIAPGDPLYFQINSGFGTTVADGVVNAIQNAVTNVAMDITVRASDPRVHLINHSGSILGVGAGQTASFDIEFVGDGKPHRFDIEFIREGTSVVLGSIPVVLGTPILGENYQYDELEDGEIHHSSHFGHYVENIAPSFEGGADISLVEGAGPQSFTAWATNISAGPVTESAQVVDFLVTNDNPALFSTQPSVAADGSLSFTPTLNGNGTAIVTVRAHDNGGVGISGADTSAPQTFIISIAGANSAPIATSDAYVVTEGNTLAIATSGVLANDSDPDGDAISSNLVSGPSQGTLTLHADGSFEYVPNAGFSGLDTFTYVANDSVLDSSQVTVTITVTPIQHAPVASDDSYSLNEDAVLTSAAPGVLANDTDFDSDILTATLVSGTSHGTVSLNANGSFSYVPAANFSGTDSFSYRVSDGVLVSNIATVNIVVVAVNDAPTSVNDTYTTLEDVSLNVTLNGVLTNDFDVDGDRLNLVQLSEPLHGNLTLNANGTFTYVPSPSYNGSDSFTYQVDDGSVTSNVATVTISITPVNDAPVASNDSYNATEDVALVVSLPGLLANDSDIDGNVLSALRVTSPLHGTLTLSVNGTFVYTPALNYNGPDSFTYKANDGALDSNVAVVSITVAAVNDAPVVVSEAYSTDNRTSITTAAPGVLANDRDVENSPLTAVLGTGPTNGSLTLNATGSFTYTPNLGFVGTDSFTYRAEDGVTTSALATVSISVVAYVPPTKFFVVDGDSRNTFQYAADGSSLSNAALNKSDSKPRGIASNATGTMQWVIDGGGTVFVYDNRGNLAGSWTPQNVGKPEGITVWGNDLWLVDPSQDRVFKFTGGANLRTGRVNATSSFALNSGNLSSTDLVTDGTHLWVVNDTLGSDTVFRYSVSGLLEGSWALATSNPTPTGITLDPTNVNHLWVVDASTDRVYQYDGATARVSGSQAPSVSFALAATNTNAQGIADPNPTTSVNQEADEALEHFLFGPMPWNDSDTSDDDWDQAIDACFAEL